MTKDHACVYNLHVPFQSAKAKEDIVVQSHDASYQIKKGEVIFGYQLLVTRDPRVFERANEFVADRFVGEGEKMLKYVYWSNGRETEDPATKNKHCAGKDLVVLLGRLRSSRWTLIEAKSS